ncbi:hypothetical protein L226DRAFT_543001 [Lentinus tigrinus ALCF2SS1-7]|uniref:Uncharacterized protein n=1 Tax=Lentinus tigrinus ALCF2SS1-6 TaxID=1328759 RepID=A0A5C2ST57_9APHY|nr:hypothetical protein L227DRAFT_606564 [Lentinus tigrinus ALCF2SS1-6]RPD80404.1 hypothetical protein L226DRAFT_543001 [Lentinus tigrinus ALCF2SS1-7]
MSPVDNSTSTPTPISLSASARLPLLARNPGAPSLTYPSLAPRRAMHQVPFVPRPFPPPALADVPLEYIIDQLRRLAPHYWSRPETSDCTIVVSLDNETSEKMPAPSGMCDAFRSMGIRAEMSTDSYGLEDMPAARSSSRKPVRPRRMIMKLHMDYLCAHSALIRGLLSGASLFDLAVDGPPATLMSAPPFPVSRQSSVSPLRFPYILPSSTCTHPVVHLPVPDPVSFHHLVHYIYFGSTAFMEEALDNGDLTWDGLARNVEYLQMGADIKLFLGRYWRQAHAYYSDEYDSDFDDDSDSDEFMSEDDATLADPDEEGMCLADDEVDSMSIMKAKVKARARDPPRGRQRTTRRLGHSTSDPVISHRAAEPGPSVVRRNSSK